MKYSTIFLLLIGMLPLLPVIYADDNSVTVPFAETRPVIDGKFTSQAEWANANVTSFNSNGIDFHLLAKQDRNFVYLMLDGIDFQTDPKKEDMSVRYQTTLCFDGNHDSGSKRTVGDFCHTSTIFNEFGKERRGENAPIKFDYEGKSSHLDLPNKFKTGWSYGSQNDPFEESDHLMFEVKIPRTLFGSLDNVGFTFEMYAGSSPTDVVQLIDGAVWPPESDKKDPSSWGKLILPEIGCSNNLKLVFKASDGSPACVKPETKQKLTERGWVKIHKNNEFIEPVDYPGDFEFTYSSGVGGKNSYNSKKEVHVTDMVCDDPLVTHVSLTQKEKTIIWKTVYENDFFHMSDFTQNCYSDGNCMVVEPESITTLFVVAEGIKHSVTHKSSYIGTDDASLLQFNRIIELINQTLENKEEMKSLPKPKCAYL